MCNKRKTFCFLDILIIGDFLLEMVDKYFFLYIGLLAIIKSSAMRSVCVVSSKVCELTV